MSKYIQVLFIFCLVLISLNFFDSKFLDITVIKYVRYIYIIFVITISLPFFFSAKGGFVLPLQLITLSIILSIIFTNLTWRQPLSFSILAALPYLLWPVFFYLIHYEFSVRSIEKIVIIYGILYIIFYFFQFTHYGTVYFGWDETFEWNNGFPRIVFPGGGVFYLTVFMALTKFTFQSKHQWFWFILLIAGLVITFLQLTRQFIIAILIIYFIHFAKDLKLYKKVTLFLSIMGIIIFIYSSQNFIIQSLKERQKVTSGDGVEDFIRVKSGIYFLSEFSNKNINKILGNGVPYSDKSAYGIFYQRLNQFGYYFSDVGLIGLYAQFGILAVIGYVLIWIKSFKIPLDREYYYLKYYLWFLLITSLTSDSSYTHKYIISTVFVLYCYQATYNKENIINKNRYALFNASN